MHNINIFPLKQSGASICKKKLLRRPRTCFSLCLQNIQQNESQNNILYVILYMMCVCDFVYVCALLLVQSIMQKANEKKNPKLIQN